jgi:pimeloyl-ACP methyl ester carboxylesterase
MPKTLPEDGAASAPAPRTFDPTIDPAGIQVLLARLAQTRWPAHPSVEPWAAGSPPAYVRELLAEWSAFDFEAFSAKLRSVPHQLLEFDGTATHFVHVKSPHEGATPILLTHGWPSSFLEFLPMIDRLTHPDRHGGTPSDAFHVVIPSMPGFPFSDSPDELASYAAASIADRWQQLMTRLGYERFLASGTDIGARVTAWLAVRHPACLLGAHMSINAVSWSRDPSRSYDLADSTTVWIEKMEQWEATEGGYHHLQRTKPSTVAIAVSDSPAAMAAWVVEKWQAWAESLDMDAPAVRIGLLSLLTLYWVTNTFGSSIFHYHAHRIPPGPRPSGIKASIPLSFYSSAAEIGGIPPRSIIEEQYGAHRWTEFPRGGHFMATEQPDLMVADLREFRRSVYTDARPDHSG